MRAPVRPSKGSLADGGVNASDREYSDLPGVLAEPVSHFFFGQFVPRECDNSHHQFSVQSAGIR